VVWTVKRSTHWLVANTSDRVALRFLRLLVPALFSAESPELSLLHFLFYVKSGTSLQTLVSTTGGAQESRVVGGTHRICERIAEELGYFVQLEAVVRTISQDDYGVRIDFEGGSAIASHVIVAVPQTLAGRIRYQPPLPPACDALTQRIPAGSVIKFHVGYETLFWRAEGLNGFVLSLDDAFNVVLDNSPPDAGWGRLSRSDRKMSRGEWAGDSNPAEPGSRVSLRDCVFGVTRRVRR
jgi:monoamine oxidase